MPVISSSLEEFRAFTSLGPIARVRELAQRADVIFVGVGQMGDDAPLLADGFITRAELTALQKRGAVGEVAGWVFDEAGAYLETPGTTRNGGVQIVPRLTRPAIGVAAGPSKVPAIRAALKSGILNGIVTDESSARAILSHR